MVAVTGLRLNWVGIWGITGGLCNDSGFAF